jgi:hypothetical protein
MRQETHPQKFLPIFWYSLLTELFGPNFHTEYFMYEEKLGPR